MSNETKWTPGEWWVRERTTNGVAGFEICHSPDEECVTDHVYERGDAYLMAAAPDLYEALSIAVKDGPAGYTEWLDYAEEVLAKARGEQ